MRSKAKLLAWAIAFAMVGMAPAGAQEPKEFKIGVVMSLSGGFVAAAKESMDGVLAWEKAHHGAYRARR